jgi:hypothetical protein
MMGRKAARKCRVVIPIKLDFSASVGFIHKEYNYRFGVTGLDNTVLRRDKSYTVLYFGIFEYREM